MPQVFLRPAGEEQERDQYVFKGVFAKMQSSAQGMGVAREPTGLSTKSKTQIRRFGAGKEQAMSVDQLIREEHAHRFEEHRVRACGRPHRAPFLFAPKPGRTVMGRYLMLLGAGCLTIIVLTHVCETFHLVPVMGWGLKHSPGHYLDLSAAILCFICFPAGFFLSFRRGR
jgi:hypothetical protein